MKEIRTLTLEEKLNIHYENEYLIKGIININRLMIIIKDYELNTYHDFLEKGKKIDLNEIMDFPETSFFNCFLFDNHTGHIVKNNKGIYRYVTSSNDNKIVYYFDILDLLEIYYGSNIDFILDNILNGEKEWRMSQKRQLELNLKTFEENKNLTLQNLLSVYKMIHKKAIEYHLHSVFSLQKEPVYFISTRYIAKEAGISQAKANRDLILLNKLGFIDIIEKESLSKYVKQTTTKNPKLKRYYKDTRSFIIKPIQSVQNIETKIEQVLFEMKKIPKNKMVEIKDNNVREFLVNRMNEYGFLSVDILEREKYPHIKNALLIMDKLFDKRKPTKAMKMKYNIENNQYVYVNKRK